MSDDLFSPPARAAVAAAVALWAAAEAEAQAGHGPLDPLAITARFRAAHPEIRAEILGAALTQARLRHRGRERLGPDAMNLYLTPEGLEQATRPRVAANRAARLVAAGIDHVIDLGAGLGLDSRAFAAAGLRVTAIESDPTTATMLAANLAQFGRQALAQQGDVRTGGWRSALTPTTACFIDPARRAGGRRLSDPQAWSPPWSWVSELGRTWPATVAKVAPGIDHGLAPLGAETVWTSDAGDLVEASIWWPGLAGPTGRAAVVLRGNTAATLDLSQEVPAPIGRLGRYLIEPDDAVIRAGLVGALVARVDGRLLDPHVAYVTTDTYPSRAESLGRIWPVLESLDFSLRGIRSRLDALGVERLVVKKRAFAADPEQLARSLHRVGGPGAHTLFLTRVGRSPLAIICGPELLSRP